MVDILIIGGGPAGLTASIYAKRSGKDVLVLERESFGGQIASSPRVENFPTIKSISGLELIDRLLEQATELGVDVDVDEVRKIEKRDGYFSVETEYSKIEAKTIIVSTGCSPRKLNAVNMDKFDGSNVSYCAICDGFFYENKKVALIGDGNTALQYATYLSNFCEKVYVCTLFDKFFGEEVLIKSILEKANIEIIHNVSLERLNGDESLESVEFVNTITKEQVKIDVSGLFIAIGQIPHNDFLGDLVELDNSGYIITNEALETKTPGIFAAGDCRQKILRQLTTAVGDAAIAATSAMKYLNK
ncbi:MAG: FAD-dependent oxidoreductase [Bacilli bacterium]|nr:FAD-dependent oxidoreductase [Bacilli bacterium]